MKKYLILVSENSKHITRTCEILHCSEVDVTCVNNMDDAKAGLKIHSPAFVLLDFNIKGSKFLLYEIASGQWLPRPYVMVASDYANGNDRAEMLRLGADICIERPINVEEVLAVIHAVRRRYRRLPVIEYEDLTINTARRAVTMRGKQVALTNKEYEVLCVLANHVGIVLSKEEIFRTVWKCSYDPNSTNVAEQVSSLRFKLGLDRRDNTYIQTVIGIGYRFGKST